MKQPVKILAALAVGLFAGLAPETSDAQATCSTCNVGNPWAVAPTWTARTTYRPWLSWRRWGLGPSFIAARPVALAAPGCTTCYRPVCNTCVSHTVRYVPQTCYRTVVQRVPVTTYRPHTSCDPCTGCATTCMRPVTTYVQQCRRVPYTTYRAVVHQAASCCPTGCATRSCGSGDCGVTSAGPYYGANPGSSSTTSTPAVGPTPAPADSTPTPSLSPVETPSSSYTPSEGTKTFQKPAADAGAAEPALQPIPGHTQKSSSGLFRTPRLLNPKDRTAMRPAAYVQSQVDYESQDAQGWRAAR